MRVLNVPVSPELLDAWAGWLAPARQMLSPASRRMLLRAQAQYGRGGVPRVRDFADLLPNLTGGRFVWWPSLISPPVLTRVVSAGHPPCQQANVPEAVWAGAASLLPRARALAGTFPLASGPNCFGTVMGAAGVEGAEQQWMQRGPFEAFLAARTRPGGQDDRPGTLLVWRGDGGAVQHAGVTLGGGWALHKPSQLWMTPRVVLPVGDLVRFCRTRGWRLHRSSLVTQQPVA
ncbi:hypothetical protein DEIPH_ctg029orf0047 [Deinococcus phoenicis]|uniref:NlpC/P60 domain-containing protein n=1 Tax=Deinococcus phoenicis TaxID=1476583 RepID=A0A016QQP1_9DEIO|nr:hypothetical protein [Deinococcus phoenicis]EYB68039.1 hypothetical protein DEIPH_ctg029orf0047 [Deinococcus phoenicis]